MHLCVQRQLDDLDLLLRLRAGIRLPMTMQEHVEPLEALYTEVVHGDGKPTPCRDTAPQANRPPLED